MKELSAETIRVAALTSGRNVPSSRFRLREYIAPMSLRGIQIREFFPYIQKYAPLPGLLSGLHPATGFPLYAVWQGMKLLCRMPGVWASRNSDVTWLERQLLPGFLTFEPILKKPMVFDVDDAIWLYRFWAEDAVKFTARRTTVVLAGNQYLGNYFSKIARDVRILPTAVDTDRFFPKTGPTPFDEPGRFVIGWTGSSANIQCLEALESPLVAFLAEKRDALLMVISDRPPTFTRIPPDRIKFLPWSEATEAVGLRAMNTGIMPLPDNPWTRGKCAFKMIQYMATGIPVVVSPVGMNNEIMAMDDVGIAAESDPDWYEALQHIYSDQKSGVQMGRNGRSVIETHFSKKIVTAKMADLIKSIV